jgi:hypothetical protein
VRIRSIRPEFWTSEDVAALSWEDRLVFIGLWSYVDDNGVGRDDERLIVADLFPLDAKPREASARVHGALERLVHRGLITRFTVNINEQARKFIHVCNFSKHQKIDHKSRGRYPLPTSANAKVNTNTRGTLDEPSASPRDEQPIGEGEKGRRGEERTRSSADADGLFDKFWDAVPRKIGKKAARREWDKAIKETDPDQLLATMSLYAASVANTDPKFIAHPRTWLSQGRWEDDVDYQPAVTGAWWDN